MPRSLHGSHHSPLIVCGEVEGGREQRVHRAVEEQYQDAGAQAGPHHLLAWQPPSGLVIIRDSKCTVIATHKGDAAPMIHMLVWMTTAAGKHAHLEAALRTGDISEIANNCNP